MWQVQLTRGSRTEIYGTYSTQSEAEETAAAHRSTGYYEVAVSKI